MGRSQNHLWPHLLSGPGGPCEYREFKLNAPSIYSNTNEGKEKNDVENIIEIRYVWYHFHLIANQTHTLYTNHVDALR